MSENYTKIVTELLTRFAAALPTADEQQISDRIVALQESLVTLDVRDLVLPDLVEAFKRLPLDIQNRIVDIRVFEYLKQAITS